MRVEFNQVLTPKNGIIFGIVATVIIVFYIINWIKIDTVVASVTDLDTVVNVTREKTSSGRYRESKSYKKLVYTDKGTFQDCSDFLRGKIGDQFYNNLDEGQTYIFTISGHDLGFFSFYPNIIDVKPAVNTNPGLNQVN